MFQHILQSPSLVHNVKSMCGLVAAFGPSPTKGVCMSHYQGELLKRIRLVSNSDALHIQVRFNFVKLV